MFLEDVDPTVGRFRNLVTTAVISNKRQKTSDAMTEFFDSLESDQKRRIVRPGKDEQDEARRPIAGPFSSVLGGISLNLAPDIDLYSKLPESSSTTGKPGVHAEKEDLDHKKKKYAKEAWPGRKPNASGLF